MMSERFSHWDAWRCEGRPHGQAVRVDVSVSVITPSPDINPLGLICLSAAARCAAVPDGPSDFGDAPCSASRQIGAACAGLVRLPLQSSLHL